MALKETIRLMKEIDEAIDKYVLSPGAFDRLTGGKNEKRGDVYIFRGISPSLPLLVFDRRRKAVGTYPHDREQYKF